MSTMHVRHRKMLSAARKTGLQCDKHAAMGRAARHAQGWRECNDLDDGLQAGRAIVWSAALGAVLWGLMLVALLLITGCGSGTQQQAAQCWCNRPVYNGVTGRYDKPSPTSYPCTCGSEEQLRFGV